MLYKKYFYLLVFVLFFGCNKNKVDQTKENILPVSILSSEQITYAKQSNLNPIINIPVTETVNIRMVLIPPGSFQMGSNSPQAGNNEKPQHNVSITKGFYICSFEVTQKQWQLIMGKDPSRFKGENNPVESVSWEEAVDFCEKLGKLTGNKFSLPTEAEWEYACRASTTTTYFWGDNLSKEYSNYGNSSTKPVGSYPANKWGLFDMSGNVWEWCSDWYDPDYYKKSPEENPKGTQNGSTKSIRGGGWYFSKFQESYHRYSFKPKSKYPTLGFRFVKPCD